VSECVVPDEPEVVAGLVEDLITDPAEAIRMGRAMRAAARSRYDWARFSREWLRCLETVVKGRPALQPIEDAR
jgi:glycosyltransferase involved in cell wall biosynthesis